MGGREEPASGRLKGTFGRRHNPSNHPNTLQKPQPPAAGVASDTHKIGQGYSCLRKPQDMGGFARILVVVVVMEEVGGHRLQLMIRTSQGESTL